MMGVLLASFCPLRAGFVCARVGGANTIGFACALHKPLKRSRYQLRRRIDGGIITKRG